MGRGSGWTGLGGWGSMKGLDLPIHWVDRIHRQRPVEHLSLAQICIPAVELSGRV